MPVLSVIIPTYNSEIFIGACLDSIINQSFRDFEILIVDGSSTDKTLQIADSYRKDHPYIRYHSEPDAGIYDAMNKGIKMATGSWIYFLGSDDTLTDQNVFKRVFTDNKDILEGADYLYGNVLWGRSEIIYNGPFYIYDLYEHNICHQGIFIRKTVFDLIGTFDLKYRVAGDWEFNIRCFLSPKIVKRYLNILIAKYSLDGTSGNNKDENFDRDKRSIFFNHLSSLPIHQQIKFKALYWRQPGFINGVVSFFYTILYRLLWAVRFLIAGKA